MTAVTAGPDCEARRATFPAEPANATSSLAFLPGALLVAARAGRTGHATSDRLVAGALAANGFGSFWYHARHGRAARLSHDWAIAALLWLLAAGTASHESRRRLEVAGLVATGLTHAAVPSSAPVVHGVVATSATIALARAGRRDAAPPGSRRRAVVTAVALAAGAVAYLGGRPQARCCRPDSLLQPHAAWHVLAAVSSTAVALDVIERRRA